MGDFLGGILDFLFNAVSGASLPQALVFLLENNKIDDVMDALQGLSDSIFLPVAAVLVCIYFSMEVMDQVTSDRFNSDQMLKLLLKLGCEILVVSNASDIAEQIVSFGTGFTTAVGGNLGQISFATTLDDVNLIKGILLIVIMILPFAVSIGVVLAGYFQIFAYQLEFAVYAVAAPIGLADFLSKGIHSNGMAYLRRLIALAIQGGIMIMIIYAGSALQVAVLGADTFDFSLSLDGIMETLVTLFNYLVGGIGIQVAIVGTLGQAKQISQALIG